MTKPQLTENTEWAVKTGAIVCLTLAGCFWFHNRLAAVEVVQAEQRTETRLILETVRRIEDRINVPRP